MITVRRVTLPAGLSALALRDGRDDLTLFVSDAITPDRQRAAVRVALRASRRSGWRAALIPVLGVWLLALGRTWLGGLSRAVRAHAAATAAATILTAAAATATIALVPHQASPGVSAGGGHPGQALHRGNGGSLSGPGNGGPGSAHPRRAAGQPRAKPGATATAPVSAGHPAPSASPTHPTPQPSPHPTGSPTPAPTGSPTPTPKPPPGGNGGTCVWLLGIKVCV